MSKVRSSRRTASIRGAWALNLLACLAACNRTEVHGDGETKYVVRYFPNHIRKEEGLERNGKREGIWTHYFGDTGNRCVQNSYVHDVLDGLTVGWHENGEVREEGQFRNGEACGRWVNWFESGVKHSERVFEHGKANGPTTWWFENGLTSSVGSFLQDLQNGEWRQWYESGQPRSVGSYINGKKEGQWDFFSETGELDGSLTGIYLNDELVERRVQK